jgi:hypothetical protein
MGRRNAKKIPTQTRGKLSRNRWAWCKVYFGDIIIWIDYIKNQDHTETDIVGDIKLIYPQPNRAPVSWNLTSLTTDEIDAFKEIIDTAFAMARPICEWRDKEAADAFAKGDDTHARIYRAIPQLVYREGTVREYRESLFNGPQDADVTLQRDRNLLRQFRDTRVSVAELDEASGITEDDREEADLSEELRQVGEVGDGTERVPSTDASQDPPAPASRPDI